MRKISFILIFVFATALLFAQNNCLDFDGTEDYVTVPDNAVFDFNSFTVEAWVMPNTLAGNYSIIGKSNAEWPVASTGFDLETSGTSLYGSVWDTSGSQKYGAINLTHLCYWYIEDRIWFFANIIMLILYIFLLVVVIINIIHLIRYKYTFKLLIPIFLNIITIIMVLIIPFTSIFLDLDFRVNFKQRMNFIEDHSGQLITYKIKVSKQYGNISLGGNEVLVSNKDNDFKVLFFTYRGILDNFSGYVYSKNNIAPDVNDFGDDFYQIDKIEENWFWVSSK
ncbi:MAG: LamG domain-containing protein [Melioribacteraceae bacterium]|nr:LamG domain-containing protein [Melioribacteraceae bacterium]